MKKLSKEDHRLIAKIAKSLPTMVNTKEKISQTVYSKTGYQYLKSIQKEVNHRKELEKMFLKFGEVGLATYEKQVRASV